MTDYYERLNLSTALDVGSLFQELNKMESLWRRREVTNPEKAAKMIALILEAKQEFKDERSKRDYDNRLEQSGRRVEPHDPNADKAQIFLEWKNKLNTFYRGEQYDLAQSALERAFSYMPADYEDSGFFNQAAYIYYYNKNYSAAMDCVNKAIIFDSNNPDCYLTKGIVYDGLARNQYVNAAERKSYREKIEETFLRAREIAIQQNNAIVRGNAAGALAVYYDSIQEEDRAEAFAQEAIDYADVWGNGNKILHNIQARREARERDQKERQRREEEIRRRKEEEENIRVEEAKRRAEEQRREEIKKKEHEDAILKNERRYIISVVITFVSWILSNFVIMSRIRNGGGGFLWYMLSLGSTSFQAYAEGTCCELFCFGAGIRIFLSFLYFCNGTKFPTGYLGTLILLIITQLIFWRGKSQRVS